MVIKVRGKSAKKAEKGKILKGRKGKIWSILNSQDSTEQVNKVIVEDCKNIILKLENEIEARKKIIKSLGKNIQSIHDVNAMQNQYINERSVVNTNFDDLAFYTLNEEIKIVTTLRKGRYTVPTKPNKWKQAQLEADFLVEQSIDEEMIAQITKEYVNTINHAKKLNISVAGEFIFMASLLTRLKTRMLLPRREDEEGLDIDDPRVNLVDQLIQYKTFKKIANQLKIIQNNNNNV